MDPRNMNEYTVEQLMPASPQLMDYSFTGTYTDTQGAQHNVTVFSNDYFFYNALQYYAKRQITLPGDLSNAMGYFHDLFYQWKNSRSNLYCKQAYAYTLAYNPIENYSSREDLINDVSLHTKGTSTTRTLNNMDTRLPNISNTETFDNYKEKDDFHNDDTVTDTNTILTSPLDTTTEEKMAFNSSDFSGDRKTSRGGTIKEEHNPTEAGQTPGNTKTAHTGFIDHTTSGSRTNAETGSDMTIHSGTITDSNAGIDTDTHNYTLTKAGNIGVMTPAEMLNKEFEGLSQDLAFRALAEFFDRYTYYNEALEGWW